jgi:hypothetical protein
MYTVYAVNVSPFQLRQVRGNRQGFSASSLKFKFVTQQKWPHPAAHGRPSSWLEEAGVTVDVSNDQSGGTLVSSPSPSLLREVERARRGWAFNGDADEGASGVGSKTKGIFS